MSESEAESVVEEMVDWQEDSSYRAGAARINYLSMDRPDLQHSSKSAAQHMSSPCAKGWRKLKRIGRYLIKSPNMVQLFPFEKKSNMVYGDGDSDWAGEREDRKSTSGGVLRIGSHVVKTWSSTQQTISLSSAESELYALTKAATQAIGLMQLLEDFGLEIKITIKPDSGAAIAISNREGLGRTRHIHVQYLWIQQELTGGRINLAKVDTKYNVADILTKRLQAVTAKEHLDAMHFDIKKKSGFIQSVEKFMSSQHLKEFLNTRVDDDHWVKPLQNKTKVSRESEDT